MWIARDILKQWRWQTLSSCALIAMAAFVFAVAVTVAVTVVVLVAVSVAIFISSAPVTLRVVTRRAMAIVLISLALSKRHTLGNYLIK